MTISPELQAKIDALEDEDLKARILRVITGPGKKRVSDEVIFENSVATYSMAKEQRDRTRKWRTDEVAAFARYFMERNSADYEEFVRQEKEFHEIESGLAWSVRRLISEWMPDLNSAGIGELFGEFRDYVESSLR
ncbi:hypothetical protein [Lysobacter capsici]|uniref:hypothetical protein n=1 Tax=Lysobacter capsici TaxID=435897 RepID=UPI001C003A68|nr:hypothetical protein [Lysobacter capsici]QWF17100.1 hypothetical protein KME82_25810 [Lysobacter capsici]